MKAIATNGNDLRRSPAPSGVAMPLRDGDGLNWFQRRVVDVTFLVFIALMFLHWVLTGRSWRRPKNAREIR